MTGSTPPWKRRFRRKAEADPGPQDGPHGVRDDERGPSGPGVPEHPGNPGEKGTPGDRGASLASDGTPSRPPVPWDSSAPTDHSASADSPTPTDSPAHTAPPASPDEALPAPAAGGPPAPVEPSRVKRRRAEAARLVRTGVRAGVRMGDHGVRLGLTHLADRIIDIAPRVPVRDLATLRQQFPGLGPEEIADRLVTGAAAATATVGAGVGAAAMMPVPPAMPTELAAEITGVAAVELKLIAELYEVYGVRPPGTVAQRSVVYLRTWSGERGIDVTKPATLNTALAGPMKRELRQQITKRLVRDLPNLIPFLIGAAVGAALNRRETRRLAKRVRADLRRVRTDWPAVEA
ncbi:hypothetical protein [Streptomyces sp. MH192]|uniref:hypothetical protein n=1 Tax=unclassified Streptomyces TaxID=2593676 RepID=UPI0035A9A01B|nr:hypothetical protein [Streptomyces sp. MH192]MCF0099364.1 hypothetical protein [Streptomyces sp. MH191]